MNRGFISRLWRALRIRSRRDGKGSQPATDVTYLPPDRGRALNGDDPNGGAWSVPPREAPDHESQPQD